MTFRGSQGIIPGLPSPSPLLCPLEQVHSYHTLQVIPENVFYTLQEQQCEVCDLNTQVYPRSNSSQPRGMADAVHLLKPSCHTPCAPQSDLLLLPLDIPTKSPHCYCTHCPNAVLTCTYIPNICLTFSQNASPTPTCEPALIPKGLPFCHVTPTTTTTTFLMPPLQKNSKPAIHSPREG